MNFIPCYTLARYSKLKIMIQGENQLTDEKKKLLKQETKVEFKWHGSKSLYTGRIELDKYDNIYFINEHCFENNKLKAMDEGMRYYNRLDSFFFFTHFKVLK
jgi:hypothetical protein